MIKEKNTKILLLGSAGNLGSQLLTELTALKAYEVAAWTRKDCDVTHLTELEDGVRRLNPSVVINTVAGI